MSANKAVTDVDSSQTYDTLIPLAFAFCHGHHRSEILPAHSVGHTVRLATDPPAVIQAGSSQTSRHRVEAQTGSCTFSQNHMQSVLFSKRR